MIANAILLLSVFVPFGIGAYFFGPYIGAICALIGAGIYGLVVWVLRKLGRFQIPFMRSIQVLERSMA